MVIVLLVWRRSCSAACRYLIRDRRRSQREVELSDQRRELVATTIACKWTSPRREANRLRIARKRLLRCSISEAFVIFDADDRFIMQRGLSPAIRLGLMEAGARLRNCCEGLATAVSDAVGREELGSPHAYANTQPDRAIEVRFPTAAGADYRAADGNGGVAGLRTTPGLLVETEAHPATISIAHSASRGSAATC
jgi:hypothetical protein